MKKLMILVSAVSFASIFTACGGAANTNVNNANSNANATKANTATPAPSETPAPTAANNTNAAAPKAKAKGDERTGQKISRMHLYYTGVDGGNPYVSFTKDDRAIGKTIARFDDIVARIEQQNYQIAARPANLCLSCDMRAYCDNKNWKFRKNDR